MFFALRMAVVGLAILPVLAMVRPAFADEATQIKIGYLRTGQPRLTLSLRDRPAANDGLAGAQLAVADDNTTGRFLNQNYTLTDQKIAEGQDPAPAMEAFAGQGILLVITDLPADQLLKAAKAGAAHDMVLFNAGSTDDRLREEDCRANVVHTAPTRTMLADGLAQYLVWKRWAHWALMVGSHPDDTLWADALKRAAKRFGAKIVDQRTFQDTGGARETDSGIAEIQQQIPLITQGMPDYEVLIAADESEVFGGYLPYRTTQARPVAGSAGLVPTSWDASMEQWGATQLQDRFMKKFSRTMSALDMQAWTAARMIGEAASRKNSTDPHLLLDFMKSPEFALAAFKGQGLTLRTWNLQLRQPILLSDGRNIVSISPQAGFLHQYSELDTLGLDKPETKCVLQ